MTTDSATTVAQRFTELVASASTDVEFRPSWHQQDESRTQQLPGAVSDRFIHGTDGTVVRCKTTDGRWMLAIKSRWGNIVIYERWAGSTDVLICYPREIGMLFNLGFMLTLEELTMLFSLHGAASDNCVRRLVKMHEHLPFMLSEPQALAA